MYVNAMEERDDQSRRPTYQGIWIVSVYQQLLIDPKASVDAFFVTEPPLRSVYFGRNLN